MSRFTRRLIIRPVIARIDRSKAAAVKARFGRAPEGAFTLGRPHHREEPRQPRRPDRYGGPRFVRDGNVITLVPASAGISHRKRPNRQKRRAA